MSPTPWEQLRAELRNDPVLTDLDDAAVQAIVEALAFTVHADQKLSPIELVGLHEVLLEASWSKDHRKLVLSHLPRADAKARAARDDKAAQRLARDIADRLPERAWRQRVYRIASCLAQADLKLEARENAALAILATALEVSPD